MLISSESILAGIKAKSKRAAISQSYGKLQHKILLQNIFITKDECRLLIKVRLKRLKSAAVWAFALFCSVVIVLSVFLHLQHQLAFGQVL